MSQTEVFGEAVGITFIVDCLKEGNRDLVKSFCLYQGRHYSNHLPKTEGRFLGRRGEGGELVLGLLWPLFGGLNHLLGVSGHRRSSDGSEFLLGISRTTGGLFRMWNAEGCSGFWWFRPSVQPDVGQSSAWRGLSRV